LSSSKNPSNAGESVTFTATVTVTQGQGNPTGNVVFKDGNSSFATVPLGGNGAAQATTSFTAGTHNITAQYAGDGNFTGSTSAVVVQQVNAVNAPPTAQPDGYSVNEGGVLNVSAPGVLGNDSDPNGDPLTAVKLTDPAHGTLTLNADGSFTYTPQADFNGPDSFTYAANDGTLNSGAATVTITVNPVNSAPSFSLAGDNISVNANDGAQTVSNWATNISAGPPNEAGQTVSFDVSNNNPTAFGLLGVGGQPAIDGDGTLTFTPGSGAGGTIVTVTVTAKDNGGTANGGHDTSAPQTFTITIN
jgi:VCBS repeat-containing protein